MRYHHRDMSMFVYGPRDRFSDLFRNGFIKITDFGVDVGKLKEEIRAARNAETWEDVLNGNTRWNKNMHFHALDGLMENKAILELISFYMGTDVVINGYQYWHADANATKERITTGEWHHDNCGTRAKMFVYLHDIDELRMPTEIAIGSQTHLKLVFGGASRFTDQAVSEAWKTEMMTGPAGGGFIFDPNTIHRSYMDYMEKPHLSLGGRGGHLSRDVVVIDISSAIKNDVGIPSANKPCPKHNWRTRTVNSGFKYPDPTHGPITTEYLKQNNGTKHYELYYTNFRKFYSDSEYEKFLFTDFGGEGSRLGASHENKPWKRIRKKR